MSLLIRRASFVIRDAQRIERHTDLLMHGDRIAAIGRNLIPPSDAQIVAPYLSLEAILQAWRDVGLRGVGVYNLANQWVPHALLVDEGCLRRSALALLETIEPGGLAQVALGPSTLFVCDEGLLRWVAETAADYRAGVHIHVSETAGEVAESLETWGSRPVRRLEEVGLLGPHVSAVHCVHVDQDEIDLLARSGTMVVHCPKPNMKLADGVMPWAAMEERGARVALGNDGAASNDLLDMWEEMRTALLLASATTGDPGVISPAGVFRAATERGAEACRVAAGVLDPGWLADIVVVDLAGAHLRPIYNILETLVFCARAADVRDTIINGRPVMRDRQILTVDEAALVDEADAMGRRLAAAAGRPPADGSNGTG